MPARLFRILTMAAILPLLLYFALFLHNNAVLAVYPFSIEWGEGIVLDLARRVASPASVYRPLNDYPYIVGIYPPAYLYCANLAGRFFDNPFLGGRIVALSAVLGSAFLIFVLLMRETRRWEISLVGALTYASLSFVYDFAAMARVDSSACFFALLGVFLLSRRRPYWGVLFFAAAVYTKQSAVAAPAACLAWLAFTERRRSAGPILFFFALVSALFLVLQAVTGGQFFVHVVPYMRHGYRLSQLWFFLLQALAETFVLLAFALFYIASGLRSRPRLDLFSVYWLAVCSTLLFTGKAGSSFLYLMEYGAASSILLGLSLSRIYGYVTGLRPAPAVAASVVVFALLGVQIYGSLDTCFYVKRFDDPATARRVREEKECVDMIAAENGPVLAENVGLLVSAGKEVLFHPFAMAELDRLGLWDERRFVEDIRYGKFSLIVLESLRPVGRGSQGVRTTRFTHERFTDGMLDAIFKNYRAVSVTGRGWVFRPVGGSDG